MYLDSEAQKSLLFSSNNFSAALLFSIIDRADTGFVDFNNLHEFFETQGVYPYEEEVISILKRLDKDDDGRITLAEFKAGLAPKNFKGNFSYKRAILTSVSPKRSPSEKRLLSPTKQYPFDAIRKTVGSPTRGLSPKVKVMSGEKSMLALKSDVKRELSASKWTDKNNSPFKKKTPEKRSFNRSFHNDELKKHLTDSKAPSRKSPLGKKKQDNINSLKKSLEKQMELSKKISQFSHKKSGTLTNFSSSHSKPTNTNASPVRPKSPGPRSPTFKQDWCELVDFFKKIIVLEREVERIKQDLSLRPDFNLMDFFAIFDRHEKGYLNQNEIKSLLESIGVTVKTDPFHLFLRRFDRNNFGRFKFSFFFQDKFRFF